MRGSGQTRFIGAPARSRYAKTLFHRHAPSPWLETDLLIDTAAQQPWRGSMSARWTSKCSGALLWTVRHCSVPLCRYDGGSGHLRANTASASRPASQGPKGSARRTWAVAKAARKQRTSPPPDSIKMLVPGLFVNH